MPSDNVSLNPGTGGATLRTLGDASGFEWPTGVAVYATTVSPGANVLQVVTPSAGLPVAQQGAWTVTANVGTPGSLALDASVSGLLVGQGAATSGQKGPLIQGAVTTAAPTYTTAQASPLSLDTSGNLRVLASPSGTYTVSGTVAATQSGTWNVGTVTTVSAVTAITNPLPAGTNTIGGVTLAPASSGGASAYSLIAAASANATNVKASAGQLLGIELYNTTAAALYVKFYDSATTPTAGSGTPVWRVMVPANGGVVDPMPYGLQFAAGIAFTTVANPADNDATAVGAAALLINLRYK